VLRDAHLKPLRTAQNVSGRLEVELHDGRFEVLVTANKSQATLF
jgi:hypothetical protein